MSDISLDSLLKDGQLSVRSTNLCRASGLTSLSRIIAFYERFEGFSMIRNCGTLSNNELIALCENHIAINTINNPHEILIRRINNNSIVLPVVNNRISMLSESRIVILQKHFLYLFAKLSKRSKNGLVNAVQDLHSINSIERILSDTFDFYSIRNIGIKSSEELELLRIELHKTFEYLISTPDNKLGEDYSKLILKSTFPDLSINLFEEKSEFFKEGKLKLFKLLNHLIESSQMLNESQRHAFKFMYTVEQDYNISPEIIANNLNLTKERFRQIRVDVEKRTYDYFQFLENIKIEDILDYGFKFDEYILVIDDNMCDLINDSEQTYFNKNFISLVFNYFIGFLFKRFGYQTFYEDENLKRNGFNFKNNYYIYIEDFNAFKYELFINDFLNKFRKKRTKTELINLKIYALKFVKEAHDPILEHLLKAIKLILSKEFEIKFTKDDEIVFELNKKKQVHEYYYSIIEDYGEPMKLSDITKYANRLFPFLNSTNSTIRGILGREKTKFIYFGRSSTYGLKVWEQNRNDIKGGTIRDLVENYLSQEDGPRHINDILKYLSKYRKTNSVSVLRNLKLDVSNKFTFYKGEVVGLFSRHNDSLNHKLIDYRTSWEERFIEVVRFRALNPTKWPSPISENKVERAGYSLLYMSKKKYKEGKLENEKVELIRILGFDLDS